MLMNRLGETGMTLSTLLALALIFSAVQLSESESNVFPINEIKGCLAKRFAASENVFCFTEDCESSRMKDAVVPCLLMGYDLLYQDSSYQLKGDSSVQRMAHCAITKCAEALTESEGTMGLLSGFGDSVYSCLIAMSDCVKNKSKFKLRSEL